MFALVDANSYYCSAEQVFRPEWRNKPIVVLSNNDGCIVAANRQAKEVGIKKFAPYFQQRELCEKKGVIALSSNYELYADLSAKMMSVIGRYAPDQYVYSIDETFLSFEGVAQINLDQCAHEIRRAVWRECRLPVSVGVGPTLTLAKAANHAAKKVRGYRGVCCIPDWKSRSQVLAQMHAGDIWGVGRKLSKHLAQMGVHSALQLSELNPALASKQFSVELERTIRELNGTVCKHWKYNSVGKKQVFSTRSTGQRITQLYELQQALCKHVGIVAAKLRQQSSLCTQLLVFAHSSPFDSPPARFHYHHRLEVATNDTLVLSHLVHHASYRLFRAGVRYYKIGVGAVEITQAKHHQLDLFSADKSNPKLMALMDSINQRYGSDTVKVARQGFQANWHMRRDRLTPQYTTKWQCLPKIKC